MKVATIVFAHGDALNVVNRHLPIWRASTDELLIVSPKDNPCVIEGTDCLTHSARQHHGPHALRRQLFAMKAALGYEADQYVFIEYDAFMLRRPEPREEIQGNLFNSHVFYNREEKPMREGKCFLHFPWIFPAKKLQEFVSRVFLDPEDGIAHDVWMAQRLMELNFPIHNLLGLTAATPNGVGEGYSQNSFDTPERISNAVYQVKQGAYALHGIKTREALHSILRASGKLNLIKRVYTYYENINFHEQDKLIGLWAESWEKNGFEATVLNRSHAEGHPFYEEFLQKIRSLHLKIAGKPLAAYGEACWLRWLAYASQPEGSFYVSDYDVINYRLVEPSFFSGVRLLDGSCPCIASGSPGGFEGLCRNYINFTEGNVEDFCKIYHRDSKFVWFHDQEFFTIAQELSLKIEMVRERHRFMGIPTQGEFWKKQLVHYGHNLTVRQCEQEGVPFTEAARCNLISRFR